ncbi:MAG: peptide-methionine (S)-S-oxide reductase MsrA [Bacteroidota bacterium]
MNVNHDKNLEIATLGGGCFWCVEAVYQELNGVKKVISGYSGGHVKNPSYKAVTTGTTGHAEVVQVHFDPEVVSFEEVLDVFFRTHNPTTLNRQGADVGTQYRSVIFFHDEVQQQIAEAAKQAAQAAEYWPDPFVTEISPFTEFYKAEDYHQDYYSLNSRQGYCVYVIQPKLEKFRKEFKDRLKKQKAN